MINLIRPKFEIINFPADILRPIEIAARTCYKSEDLIKEGSAERLVKHLIANDHMAMFEFVDIHVKLFISRAIANEVVRHRIPSYAQSSTRYCNYSGKPIDFIIPHWATNVPEGVVTGGRYKDVLPIMSDLETLFVDDCLSSASAYNDRIDLKQKPEDARGCLTNDLATEINIKTNLREWLHIFKLRRSMKAHPDIRLIMDMLYEEFNKRCPIIFK